MTPAEAHVVTPRRLTIVLLVGLAAVLACILICPLIGPSTLSLQRAFAGQWPDNQMFFGVRLPRVLLALLCGGALSIAGCLFQALLRDALATPYTLGVSSGASLGAVVAICFGFHTIAGLPGIWGAALLGAAVTLLIVLAVASEGNRMSSFTLLRGGVEIFELEREILHAKVMLIDAERTVIGSANLDQRSFHRNFEINCLVDNVQFGGQIRLLLQEEIAGSRQVELDIHEKRGLLIRLMERVVSLFGWFL